MTKLGAIKQKRTQDLLSSIKDREVRKYLVDRFLGLTEEDANMRQRAIDYFLNSSPIIEWVSQNQGTYRLTELLYEDDIQQEQLPLDYAISMMPSSRATKLRLPAVVQEIKRIIGLFVEKTGLVRIANYGSGPGRDTVYVARELKNTDYGEAMKVTCFDVDPEALQKGEDLARKFGVLDRFTFVQRDIGDIINEYVKKELRQTVNGAVNIMSGNKGNQQSERYDVGILIGILCAKDKTKSAQIIRYLGKTLHSEGCMISSSSSTKMLADDPFTPLEKATYEVGGNYLTDFLRIHTAGWKLLYKNEQDMKEIYRAAEYEGDLRVFYDQPFRHHVMVTGFLKRECCLEVWHGERYSMSTRSGTSSETRRLFCEHTERLAYYLGDLEKLVRESGERKVFATADSLISKMSAIVYDPGFCFADECMAFFRQKIRPFFLEADFTSHVIRKPFGYPGDFLAMEKIWEGCNMGRTRVGSTPRGQLLNAYVLQLPACKATNERTYVIKDYVEDCIRCVSSPRIASIGAGSCIEIRELIHEGADLSDATFTLVDFDQNAIAYAQRQLSETGVPLNANFVHSNVVKEALKDTLPKVLGTCDFIYAVGFFDYLSIEVSNIVARILWGSVVRGGQLIIVNAHPLNPTRFWMEGGAEWHLQYKTEEQMTRIAEALEPADYQLYKGHDGVYQYLVLNKVLI